MEELKNLLVQRFLDANAWEWEWAKERYRENRGGLANRTAGRTFGFTANGKH